uniref:Uncharacterized protein n=1 Tax=Siphoviridae sp. ctQLz13 TaxID=2825492 RepID=A0A8S5NW26_9CAUD|nr:MAG TPA: hypothetical protein [Siphoviridae sp. ctQLz13]
MSLTFCQNYPILVVQALQSRVQQERRTSC